MAERINKIVEYDLHIMEKMRELLEHRNNTLDFLEAEHSLEDTKLRLKEIRTSTKEISEIAVALIDHKTANPKDRLQIDVLLEKCHVLNGYSREIRDYLDKDLGAAVAKS